MTDTDRELEYQLNQHAYRLLKEQIDSKYPRGRFVAIAGGRIIADAANLNELIPLLQSQGFSPPDTLAVEAGVDYPEYAIILSPIQPL
jgi:hypothetical protein